MKEDSGQVGVQSRDLLYTVKDQGIAAALSLLLYVTAVDVVVSQWTLLRNVLSIPLLVYKLETCGYHDPGQEREGWEMGEDIKIGNTERERERERERCSSLYAGEKKADMQSE